MSKIKKPEVIYYFKKEDDDTVTITKFIDGESTPSESYPVGINRATCVCKGFVNHKMECRHLKMRKIWVKRGMPQPFAYNYDKNIEVKQETLTNEED